jgi:hypothetical protein
MSITRETSSIITKKVDKIPFIIIDIEFDVNFDNLEKILIKKYEDDEIIIFGIDTRNLATFLKEKNIMGEFAPIADILLYKNIKNRKQTILLINKNTGKAKLVQSYDKIMKLGNGYIWKPKNYTFPSFFVSIGLIYSVNKPNGYYIIDSNYVTNSDIVANTFSSSHLIKCNKFGMFVLEHDEQKTVDLQKIKYLSTENNQYITNCHALSAQKITEHPQYKVHKIAEGTMFSPLAGTIVMSNIESKDNKNTEQQTNAVENKMIENFNTIENAKYLQDGRVEIINNSNAQCLTLDDADNVKPIDCVNTNEQQWIYNNGNLINRKTGKCLDEKNLNQLKICGETGEFINPSEPDTKYPSWNKKFGKNVVLVSANDPWYLNKESTTKVINEPTRQDTPAELTTYPKPYGTFKLPKLQKIQDTQPTAGVEFFVDENEKLRDRILSITSCILLLIIIIQIFYIVRH